MSKGCLKIFRMISYPSLCVLYMHRKGDVEISNNIYDDNKRTKNITSQLIFINLIT